MMILTDDQYNMLKCMIMIICQYNHTIIMIILHTILYCMIIIIRQYNHTSPFHARSMPGTPAQMH